VEANQDHHSPETIVMTGSHDFPGVAKETLARRRQKSYPGRHRVAPSFSGRKPRRFFNSPMKEQTRFHCKINPSKKWRDYRERFLFE
jgi:hypothetical protein